MESTYEQGVCRYKDVFGAPREGVHSIRLFDIAIVDLGLTTLAAYGISYYTEKDFWLILCVLLILGIIFHRMFCVETTIDKLLF
jgi:fatty acid desaturase